MILDIRFTDKGPSQYQGVRMYTVYPQYDGSAVPQIVIHFSDYTRRQVNINLSEIVAITTTND
jgi:hypothetical protein